MPTLEVSVSTVKGSSKLGKARIGASDKACFNFSKVVCADGVHWKLSMVVSLTKVAAMVAYLLMKWQ